MRFKVDLFKQHRLLPERWGVLDTRNNLVHFPKSDTAKAAKGLAQKLEQDHPSPTIKMFNEATA